VELNAGAAADEGNTGAPVAAKLKLGGVNALPAFRCCCCWGCDRVLSGVRAIADDGVDDAVVDMSGSLCGDAKPGGGLFQFCAPMAIGGGGWFCTGSAP